MEKEYNFEEKSTKLNEPVATYHRGKKLSPPLSEEEIKNALTTEEVQARIFKHIDKLFGE